MVYKFALGCTALGSESWFLPKVPFINRWSSTMASWTWSQRQRVHYIYQTPIFYANSLPIVKMTKKRSFMLHFPSYEPKLDVVRVVFNLEVSLVY